MNRCLNYGNLNNIEINIKSFNMSSVYVFKDCLLDDNEEKNPLKYLLPILLLQNYEHSKINDKDPSFFSKCVLELMFESPDDIDLLESGTMKETQEKNFEDLKKLFNRLIKTQNAKELYDILGKNSASCEFCVLMQAAIQRILINLFSSLEKDDNAVVDNSNFTEAFEKVKKNNISDDPMMVMVFLKLLRKNCRVYCDPSTGIPSRSYEIDPNYPFLFLYLDDKSKFRFLLLEKPNLQSESSYEKKTLKIDKKFLVLPSPVKKQPFDEDTSEKSEDDSEIPKPKNDKKGKNPKQDEEEEEKSEKSEDEEEIPKKKKPKQNDDDEEKSKTSEDDDGENKKGKKTKKNEEDEEKKDWKDAFKEFIEYMLKIMNNWSDGFDETEFKAKGWRPISTKVKTKLKLLRHGRINVSNLRLRLEKPALMEERNWRNFRRSGRKN